MQRGKTGGNMEPMPFVRKWGSEAEGNEFEGQIPNVEPIGDISPKKHRHRDRSKSPSSKKEKKRSRSPDKKRHKRRSRSREGKSKKRSKSHERKKNRDEREEEEQQISAFPPPADILQQVHLRQQQIEMQIQQQEAARQQQMKQEIAQQQSQQQDWQQQYYANQLGLGAQQHESNQPKNDALSAALAAAAAVAQKLNKSHGEIVGTTSAAAPTEAINKMPQAPTRNTAIAEEILAKDSNGIKKEPGQESAVETDRERRKKSRWSNTKAFVPGMPTILPSDIDDNQRQIYLFQMDIEETTRRLRQGDFGQNLDPSERSKLLK